MGRYLQHKNWDEYKWEEEIRRDELRINRYFFELVPYMDLPGEEEMVIDQLASQSDLVPVGAANSSALANWCYFANEDESEEDEDDNEQRSITFRKQGDIINQLDILASSWNLAVVRNLPNSLYPMGMGISCAYGKLLARTADFTDADSKLDRALKLTLGKRVLADINCLLTAMSYLMTKEDNLHDYLNNQKEELIQIREIVIDALSLLWNEENK
jgi:hypothetical protein